MNDVLIVSDMADLRAVRLSDREKFDPMDFVFSSRDGHKLHGWVPEVIYITMRAQMNMASGVGHLINLRRAQGSAVVCLVS
jgi:hypothetical protein